MDDSNNIYKICCLRMRVNISLDIYVLQYIFSYFFDDVIFRFFWDFFYMIENIVYRIYMVYYLLEIFYYYREVFVFVIEFVFVSLVNVLGDYINVLIFVFLELIEYKLFDVEIKYGIIQVNVYNKNFIFV